ncbi:hypothetical protein H4Q26_017233 [Puccinia striiformis f. sp. tritici PST-130]|nr:hypothetical protein H4Q26_017233 [Puccinia striiformis f. sp. tritici PST-130]
MPGHRVSSGLVLKLSADMLVLRRGHVGGGGGCCGGSCQRVVLVAASGVEGFIAGTISLFTVEDVFQSEHPHAHLDALVAARTDATHAMRPYQDPLFLSTIGQKITGTRSDILGYESHSAGTASRAEYLSDARNRFKKRIVLDPLLDCHSTLMAAGISLAPGAKTKIGNLFGKISQGLSTSMSQPGSTYAELHLFQDFENLYKLLTFKDEISLTSKPLGAPKIKILNSIVFRLNDILVAYLSAAEKYNLVSPGFLKTYLNEKNEGMMIFHYIWGNLARSPFTEDISGLLKHLDMRTWQKVSRSYIMLQLMRHPATADLRSFRNRFFQVTSPQKLGQFDKQQELANDLTKSILSLSAHWTTPTNLVNLKLTHNMLSYLMQYHIIGVSSSSTSAHQVLYYQSQIKTVDEALILFSAALKSTYSKYGEVIQILAGHSQSPSSDRGESPMIYLTDMNKRNKGSMFPRGPRYASDQELFQHAISVPANIQLQSDPGHLIRQLFQSWKYQDELAWHPTPGIEPHHELETPQLIMDIIRRSKEIFKQLQKFYVSESNPITSLLQAKSFLEEILRHPLET